MKLKKFYSTPTTDVAEVKLDCTMLSESVIEAKAQVEDGAWYGVESTESVGSQVEDGTWNGL